MPPRIPILSRLSATSSNASTYAERKLHKDPYVLAQSRRRKESNLERRAELKKERESMLGDPVRGVTTPFVESFDTAGASTVNFDATTTQAPGEAVEIKGADDVLLNHFLTPSELQSAIEHSRSLTEPVESVNEDGIVDPVQKEHERKRFEDHHARASAALARITPRAGPDTGSSEVQIAILTAKIRVLANQLEMKRGQKDKVNKRNLRLLVHRRQKLLKYLRKKERGGERWQNLIATLGLTEGTWQGEISL
ncbi:ribosomal S15 precursor protein [Rutstroemia sp. NJR-2017a BBW]|nr:ribosomal S15 precursor protein [Rutstroemia sp. NJR-2017a BBW]